MWFSILSYRQEKKQEKDIIFEIDNGLKIEFLRKAITSLSSLTLNKNNQLVLGKVKFPTLLIWLFSVILTFLLRM
jgi:hypothetical protein